LAALLKEKNLGRELTVLDILEHPTARGLAKFIASSHDKLDAAATTNGKVQSALAAFNEEWFPRVQEQLGGDSTVEMVLPCLPRELSRVHYLSIIDISIFSPRGYIVGRHGPSSCILVSHGAQVATWN